ncbi:MAG: DUF3052 family protein [Acidimicrobiia bacterium]|nr:DUF3052 family protein [Acidimicrobiia bacterium]
MPPAGYSGTPLAKKLGIKADTRLLPLHAPDEYATLLAPLPPRVRVDRRAGEGVDIVHVFVTRRTELTRQLTALRRALRTDAAVWVSWPKKAAKMATDVTEDTIREVALPLGFVDVKVCAVSDVWSGLKLVVRTQLR